MTTATTAPTSKPIERPFDVRVIRWSTPVDGKTLALFRLVPDGTLYVDGREFPPATLQNMFAKNGGWFDAANGFIELQAVPGCLMTMAAVELALNDLREAATHAPSAVHSVRVVIVDAPYFFEPSPAQADVNAKRAGLTVGGR